MTSILASETLLDENKKSRNRVLPQWELNLGHQHFRFGALLSELLRHALRHFEIFMWSCFIGSNQMIWVQDSSGAVTKDNLKISQVPHASMAQRDLWLRSQVQCWVQFTRATFCFWIFCFYVVKPLTPILPILPFLYVCESLECSCSEVVTFIVFLLSFS